MTNILILDDEQDWINSHKEQLEQAGFDCSTTKSGQEAIDILSRDTSIKVALIDAILKDDDEQRGLNDFLWRYIPGTISNQELYELIKAYLTSH